MPDTYTIKTAQQRFSSVVQEAEDHPVTITCVFAAPRRWIYEVFQSRLSE